MTRRTVDSPDLNEFEQSYKAPVIHEEFSGSAVGRSLKADLSNLRASPIPQDPWVIAGIENALGFAAAARG